MEPNHHVTLNRGQQHAVDSILDSLRWPKNRTILLQGQGGSGKTLTIAEALKRTSRFSRSVICAAPTHRAVAQLTKSLNAAGVTDVPVVTVHSLLNQRMKMDDDSGLMVTDNSKTFKLGDDYGAVILDEASMVSSFQLSRLLRGTDVTQTLIGVGDAAQLPPVGSEKMNWLFSNAELRLDLTEVMRHSGPIFDLCNRIRTEGLPDKISTNRGDESTVEVHRSSFSWRRERDTTLKIASRKGHYPDDLRIINYRNKFADGVAWRCRSTFYGYESDNEPWDYEGLDPQEGVNLDSARFARVTNWQTIVEPDDLSIVFPPSSELQIVGGFGSTSTESMPGLSYLFSGPLETGHYCVDSVVVREIHTGKTHEVLAVCPEDAIRFKEDQNNIEKWVRDPKNARHPQRKHIGQGHTKRNALLTVLQPQFGITGHKSQGSTYGTVFVDLADPLWMHDNGLLNDENLNRFAYVAMSRAANRLVIYDPRN